MSHRRGIFGGGLFSIIIVILILLFLFNDDFF